MLLAITLLVLPSAKIAYDFLAGNERNVTKLVIDCLFVQLPTILFSFWTNFDKIIGATENSVSELLALVKKDKKLYRKKYETLAGVVSRFFNDGKFNTRRLMEKFNIHISDYFVLIKSSENLDVLYEYRKKKLIKGKLSKFPLGKIIADIPGSLHPFGNMDIYFIPYATIQAEHGKDYKKFIDEALIPRIQPARDAFLDEIAKKSRLNQAQVDRLRRAAFTLMGFPLVNERIFLKTINNAVSEDLLLLAKTDPSVLERYTSDIENNIKSSDLFDALEWRTIVKIDDQLAEDLEAVSAAISKDLRKLGVSSMVSLLKVEPAKFMQIIYAHTTNRKRWSKKKTLAFAKKVLKSLATMVESLRAANVKI
ncbi:hypothetical protein [Turneriella parva]|uniref:hypothetical protein n=1 Tax=Turneriella parva TaxID=29510 RepID=UPI0012F6F8CA|nr:hypothetical protein [Turneriella parva]